MNTLDIISLISSIASLSLAIIAIWLSIVFYKLSTELSKESTKAAKDISTNVEKLDLLFEKLYSDTFSMMRETVSDMRKHIWPDPSNTTDKLAQEIDKKADEKLNILKVNMEKDLSNMLQHQQIADDKITSLKNQMGELLSKAIDNSKKVELEAEEETVRQRILYYFRLYGPESVDPNRIINVLVRRYRIPETKVVNEISNMLTSGILLLNSDNQEVKINPSYKSKGIK